jgi:hypothetical protein
MAEHVLAVEDEAVADLLVEDLLSGSRSGRGT